MLCLATVKTADVVIPRSQEGHVPTHGGVIVSASESSTAVIDVFPPSYVVAEVLYRTCLVVKRSHPSRIVCSVRSTAVVIVVIDNTGIRRLTRSKKCSSGLCNDSSGPCEFFHILVLILAGAT